LLQWKGNRLKPQKETATSTELLWQLASVSIVVQGKVQNFGEISRISVISVVAERKIRNFVIH